jgi:hypothetical protein
MAPFTPAVHCSHHGRARDTAGACDGLLLEPDRVTTLRLRAIELPGAIESSTASQGESSQARATNHRTKLGCVIAKLSAPDDEEPYRHAESWAREATTGPDRLRIGCGESPLEVIEQLARFLAEPLYVLVVLTVARGGSTGRYESDPLTYADLVVFIAEFAPLFSNDGRADLWIGSTTDDGLLVLDEHDLVYAYGPLDAFSTDLDARGFQHRFPADVPYPHAHYYNEEYDDLEARLIARDWRRVLPLLDADDDDE